MKILFDQGTPVPLRLSLSSHAVSTAHEMGWSELDNGNLLSAAEEAFDVPVTTGNLRHQQNLAGRELAILVLPTTSWPKIRERVHEVVEAIEALRKGQLIELDWSS